MRQLSPASNLVLAVLAGLGLLASLTTPWYATAMVSPNETDGPIERAAWQVGHVFGPGDSRTVDGAVALGGAQPALLTVVAVVGALALAIALNLLRQPAEDLLRLVAFAIPPVFVILAVGHPGEDGDVNLSYGMLIGFAAALLMASASFHGASWRRKHPAPARPRYSH